MSKCYSLKNQDEAFASSCLMLATPMPTTCQLPIKVRQFIMEKWAMLTIRIRARVRVRVRLLVMTRIKVGRG